MPRRSLFGVLVGGVVNIVAANLLNVPVGAWIIMKTGVLGLPVAERKAVYLAVLHGNPVLFGITLTIWAFCSVLGGYVAARIARRDEITVGALSSWTCVVLAVNAVLEGIGGQPIWQFVMWFPGSPLLGALGGFLGRLPSGRSAA